MKKKLKLVYVDPQAVNGNLAIYDYSLLNGLDCDITFCCSTIYDAPTLINVKYQRIFNYINKKSSILKGVYYSLSLIRLVFILAKVRPDVLHIQWWKSWYLDYLFLSIYKIFSKNIVFTAHNVVPHDTGDSMIKKCRKYYNKVDKIIVHAKRSKEELIEQLGVVGNKIYIIPHGVLSFKYDNEKIKAEKIKICSEFNLKNKLVFSALGVQSDYKGTDIIKKLFIDNKLLEYHSDVVLLVGGKGDIIKSGVYNLENLFVKDDYLSNEEFVAFMELTDVLLLPYKKISQSGVLLTAVDKQIPYIATDIGGICEPLDIASVGWKLDTASVENLKEVVLKILHDKNLPKNIKNDIESWSKVKKMYDWGEIQKKTVICYNDIII